VKYLEEEYYEDEYEDDYYDYYDEPEPKTPVKVNPPKPKKATKITSKLEKKSQTASTPQTPQQSPSDKLPTVKLKNIVEIHNTSKSKPTLNVVIIGHIDAGKSTLTGHLLHKQGLVSNQELTKLGKIAEINNKSSFSYAYILDDDESERERGVTINCSKRSFQTKKFHVMLADAPGHRDFVPNMISGAANADVAILVVDGRNGEFESGFSDVGQTKEHALIVRSLGVQNLIIAINKMDAVDWNIQRFTEIKNQLLVFLTKNVGFNKSKVWFVPVSGLSGENLSTQKFPGKECLLDLIDKIPAQKRKIDCRSIISLLDVSASSETKISCLARVESGSLQQNEIFSLQPSFENKLLVQISAVYQDESIDKENSFYAVAGQTVGVDITPVFGKFETSNLFAAGMMLSKKDEELTSSRRFRANLLILGGDAQTYDNVAVPPITRGFQVNFHIGTNEVPGKISKIIGKIDKNTGEVLPTKVRCCSKGDAGLVELSLQRNICVDFKENINTRFTIRIQGITIGSGILKSEIEKKT